VSRGAGSLSVLTVNAGSSSLRLRLLGPGDELLADDELPAKHGHADPVGSRSRRRSSGSIHPAPSDIAAPSGIASSTVGRASPARCG
jgi:hypothetical protein